MSYQNLSSTMSTPSQAPTNQTQVANEDIDSASFDLAVFPAILTLNTLLVEEFSRIMRSHRARLGSKINNELEEDEDEQGEMDEDGYGEIDTKGEDGGKVAEELLAYISLRYRIREDWNMGCE